MNPTPSRLVLTICLLGLLPSFLPAAGLTASDREEEDRFGSSVSLSGLTALVGAVKSADWRGSAYLFPHFDAATGLLTETAKLAASDGGTDAYFGTSVSLSGPNALVGADGAGSDRGAAYLFRHLDTASGLVTETAKLVASDGSSGDFFGAAVSLSGPTALVGAGGADDWRGSAYLFRHLDTASGFVTETAKLVASDGEADDYFGSSVSLSGHAALVGAVDDDASRGSVYLFRDLDTASGLVTQAAKLTASDGQADAYFGSAVSLSGSTALVGADGDDSDRGAAYLFRALESASGSLTENVKLVASDGETGDRFGNSVSLSGHAALVSAVWDDDWRGSAYLFLDLDTASGPTTEAVKLVASDYAAGDYYFGSSVSLDGDRFIIGARGKDDWRGQAYTGSVSTVTTLDEGDASRATDGLSFISRVDWIIGQTTDNNVVTLSAGDTADVTAPGKAVYVGQNPGTDHNRLIVAGSLTANTVEVAGTGGTLRVDGLVATTGGLTIHDGAFLTGTGTIGGPVAILAAGHLAPGNSPGTLVFTDGLTLHDGAILDFQLGAESDLIRVSGGILAGPASGAVTVNLSAYDGFGAGTYTLFDYTSASLADFDLSDFVLGQTIAGYTYSLDFAVNSLQLTATAIPEPAAYVAVFGLLTLSFAIWRRRSNRLAP